MKVQSLNPNQILNIDLYNLGKMQKFKVLENDTKNKKVKLQLTSYPYVIRTYGYEKLSKLNIKKTIRNLFF